MEPSLAAFLENTLKLGRATEEELAFIASSPCSAEPQLDGITDNAVVAAKKSSLMVTFGLAVVALGISTF